MTIIVRKHNLIASDSLIFNGRPDSSSIQYENKIKRNTAGTMVLAYSGNNFSGSISKLLLETSNNFTIILSQGKLPTVDDISKELKIELEKLLENLNDFCIGLFSKHYSFVIKLHLITGISLYTYTKDELVYLGSGSELISNTDSDSKNSIELVYEAIKHVSSCNGNINVFNLDLLNEIKL